MTTTRTSDVRSMTGFGAAQRQASGYDIAVEMKSVNGRFLSVSLRLPPVLSRRESDLEACVRSVVRRGTVSVTVSARPAGSEQNVVINESVVRAYIAAFNRLGLPLDSIPLLPGSIGGGESGELAEPVVTAVLQATREAVDNLVTMRRREGASLAEVLMGLIGRIQEVAGEVHKRAPAVVAEYHQRLSERVAALLHGVSVTIDSQQLAREAAVFAQRCDITEELDRLDSHLSQGRQLLATGGDIGRTLDFLAQEMHREVTTIGSKSADAALSQLVVRLKAEVERFKEQVANVE